MNEKIVLLVEDNEDDVVLMQRSFDRNRLSYQLAVARDGEEAIQYLSGSRPVPAVILLDLKLPKLNGFQVLKWLRTNPPTKYIPVVVLTTSNEERDKVASYDSGANSYIRKPVDFDHFMDATRNLGMYWLMLNEFPGKS